MRVWWSVAVTVPVLFMTAMEAAASVTAAKSGADKAAAHQSASGTETLTGKLPASRPALTGPLPSVTTPDIAGGNVNFGNSSTGRLAAPPDLSKGILARYGSKVEDTQVETNLGVAVEGVGVTLVKMKSDRVITRFNLGRDDRFYFHRDAAYDPQSYLRAREIEKGAGNPQGADSLLPRR